MQTAQLDFTGDDALTGFRLHRLEVYNWGTFGDEVWRIGPDGQNALLTGDIGSGKSTLVDAITTLLVPHHRIVYNKAAGAETRERSLYSYIRGEYKSEKDDLTQSAKAIALRDDNSYTVLLGWFYNEGFGQGATLAQVFWLKDQKRNPERFFLVAETPLSIAEHFSDFGSDLLHLKKRLRRLPHVQVLENFKEYSSRFRHLFGIQHEQALELFYQTVSMKSVGNLTDFVRSHMLEKSDVDSRIGDLRRNFDNLNRAHEAVLKAKRQVELLTPLVEDGRRYGAVTEAIAELRQCREALPFYYAGHQSTLLRVRVEKLELEIRTLADRLAALKEHMAGLRGQEAELRSGIDDHGGRRLQALDESISRLETDRRRKQHRSLEYAEHAQKLDLPPAQTEEDFHRNLQQAQTLKADLDRQTTEVQRASVDRELDLRALRGQHDELAAELDSLRSRKSNIPLKSLEIRREMAEILGLEEAQLPFVGELLQVEEAQAEWEGAIERLLHNFGLSLLVPEALYARISRYVDRTRLRGRVVYYRVREGDVKPPRRSLDPRSLVRKLLIKPDSEFYPWLEAQLPARFDYVCCDDLADFQRLPRAITRNGQIKSAGQRHEKDDRHNLQDRSRYVLGWSNEGKIAALESQRQRLEQQAQDVAAALSALTGRQKGLEARQLTLHDLLKFDRFAEIHWQPLAEQIHALEAEKRRIEETSDVLQALRSELASVQAAIAEKEQRTTVLERESAKQEERRDSSLQALAEADALGAHLTPEERKSWYPKLDRLRQTVQPEVSLTLQNLEKSQREVREHIQTRVDADEKKSRRLMERIVTQMQAYKNDYPAETGEVDAGLAALEEFGAMLQALITQDLPRHEARFKDLLNEGTINSIALFQNQLDKERQEIQEKIATINGSLADIEYDPGTFIELVADPTQDLEIRDFRQDLRQCLAHSLDQDELYDEAKFLQVKAIIERFNGREGLADHDRRWTRKVTDVRNWFNFSASERWAEDGSEKEFYSDASGKSGGQKEKLAYTILASALAYQFGLEWNAVRSRSFRFVVIDEAFGRGSDESTRYGLELFKKLNLQLLVVTPLQKVHIIEDYIAAVHFVHNEGGRRSVLRNLTVEEYRAEKQRYLTEGGAGAPWPIRVQT